MPVLLDRSRVCPKSAATWEVVSVPALMLLPSMVAAAISLPVIVPARISFAVIVCAASSFAVMLCTTILSAVMVRSVKTYPSMVSTSADTSSPMLLMA